MDSTLWMVAYRYVSSPPPCTCLTPIILLLRHLLSDSSARQCAPLEREGPQTLCHTAARSPALSASFSVRLARRKKKKKEKKKRTRSGVNSLADAADGFLRVLSFRRGSAVTNTLPPTAVVFIHKFFSPRLFG